MAPKKNRTDIYSLSAIKNKLPKEMSNKTQKLTTAFAGVAFYCSDDDLEIMAALVEKEAKEKATELRAMKSSKK